MRFEDLTTEEIASARAAGAVVLLPVGSVEPHGPHLPLSTDTLIAGETADRAARKLEAAGIRVLVLPVFDYATVEFSAGFAGAVGLASRTSQEAFTELLSALVTQEFLAVAVVTAHLEPTHLAALRAAVADVGARTGRVPVFPDITRRELAARLTEEFRSGACHAGRFETSLVLAVRPDLVREEIRRALPPIGTSLSVAIRQGRRSFLEAGLDRAYCGDPAAATAEEGREIYEILAGIVEEAVLGSLKDAGGAGR